MLFGGSGFFIDRFKAGSSDGVLWLHGYGNVFERNAGRRREHRCRAGGWLYKEPQVRMETKVDRLTAGFFCGMNFIVNRFTGPGKIGIQSMYLHMPTED